MRIHNLNIKFFVIFKVRAPQGTEPKIWAFDAEHERKRKLQLTKLFDRTQEKASQTYYKLEKSPLRELWCLEPQTCCKSLTIFII